MLQRIQSLYFLIAMISLLLMMFIPVGEIIADGEIHQIIPFGGDSNKDITVHAILPLMILLALLLIFTGVITFLFKNRVLQIKLTKLNGILSVVLIGAMVMSADLITASFTIPVEEVEVEYGIGTFLSFIPLVMNYLALQRIKKDEELVRSADRLR